MDHDIESALPLLRKGIAVFNSMGEDGLVSLAYIYLGLYHFRKEQIDAARHYLELGKRHAQKARSDYLLGYALHNLADAAALKGEIEKAHAMLDRSMKLLSGLSDSGGDLEGVAGVHFNRALVHIEEGLFDKAHGEFELSMKVAYPLPIRRRREEWKKVFDERLEKKGVFTRR